MTMLLLGAWVFSCVLAALAGESVHKKRYGYATYYALVCVAFSVLSAGVGA